MTREYNGGDREDDDDNDLDSDIDHDDSFPEHRALTRYDGEDISPTSALELRGWYSLGLAAEIFAVCGVGSFAPVTLEQLARENGVLRSDGVTPCIEQSAKTGQALARAALRLLVRAEASQPQNDAGQCVVFPFGRETSTASVAMYTFSLAVLTQALVLISFSAVADYGVYRKRMLLAFAFSGSIATMAMVLVGPSFYLLASVLVIIGVVCLGSTFVLLNSFLPMLAAHHPEVEKTRDVHDHTNNTTTTSDVSTALQMSTRISAKGVGLGYAAAVLVQIFSIMLLVMLKQLHFQAESMPLRCVLLMVGTCWLILTLPGAKWLRDRPGPPLRVTLPWRSRLPAAFQYVAFAWSSVWSTVKMAMKLRQTGLFLIAWFLLSDAIATVSGTAILFARTELHMGTIAIALLSITATTSGIAGAFVWPHIARRFGLSTQRTIVACTFMMEIIPLYGMIGFLPFVRSWGVGGLQQAWEIYPLGIVHGFVMGGLSSYCRAFYGEIIPPGAEAAFFALYAITDKGSSAVGPAIVGAIIDSVGTIRPAFAFLAILIALPMPLIFWIDVARGRAEAQALSKHAAFIPSQAIRMEDYEAVDPDHAQGESLLATQHDAVDR